jgi:hypothetical protein
MLPLSHTFKSFIYWLHGKHSECEDESMSTIYECKQKAEQLPQHKINAENRRVDTWYGDPKYPLKLSSFFLPILLHSTSKNVKNKHTNCATVFSFVLLLTSPHMSFSVLHAVNNNLLQSVHQFLPYALRQVWFVTVHRLRMWHSLHGGCLRSPY